MAWRMVARDVSGIIDVSLSPSAESVGWCQRLLWSWEGRFAAVPLFAPDVGCTAWTMMHRRWSPGVQCTRTQCRSMFRAVATARRSPRRRRGWSDRRANGDSWSGADSFVGDAASRPPSDASGLLASRNWRTSCRRSTRRTRRCAEILSAMEASHQPMIHRWTKFPSCTISPSSSSSWRACWTARWPTKLPSWCPLLAPLSASWTLSSTWARARCGRQRRVPSDGCCPAGVAWSASPAARKRCRFLHVAAPPTGSIEWSLSRTSWSQ